MKNTIIFTDLDGTLLDDNYSFLAALPALRLIKENQIPLVFCSSKTRSEIEYYRRQMNNYDPFVSENGGGIFIPKGYFNDVAINTFGETDFLDDYVFLRLGTSYLRLRNALNELRTKGFSVKGFGDMTIEDVAQTMGLDVQQATMSKNRDFDEPFFFYGNTHDKEALFDEIHKMGLKKTEGKIYHLLGDNDKGKAVSILTGLYRKKYEEVFTVAIGDGLNDVPMFEQVESCFIVEKAGGGHDERIDLPNLIKAQGIGPHGFNNTIQHLFSPFINNSYAK